MRNAVLSPALSVPRAHDPMPSVPSILIFATAWWPLSTRLALRLRDLGASVSALVPRHHMMQAVSGLAQLHLLHPLRLPQGIDHAVRSAQPDLILPCDDTAVWLLHDLAVRHPDLAPLVERSLGEPQHYALLRSRRRFLDLARSLHIRCPETRLIPDASEIESILGDNSLPIALKYDGTTGGYGVVLARTADQLREGYRMLLRHRLRLRALKRFLLDADVAALYRPATQPPDEITGQTFIPGTPANGLFVARRGEILAQLQVRVERALSATGAAIVVDRIHHLTILDAAQTIAARLQLSGFFGLDFILHAETGDPWLLEINPRATQLCHIALDPAHNRFATLADAICFVASGHAPPQLPPQPIHSRFAFFPQALTLPSHDPALTTAALDRPDEPALATELLRPVWPCRRPWLRLYNRLLHRIDQR